MEELDDIVKFVTIGPSESQNKKDKVKYQLQISDFICKDNQFNIGSLPWPIGDIELDKSGLRLVAVSQDGIYINVYTTLNIAPKPQPI